MAPKNKFTREKMIDAALQVVRAKGIDALTAKALAEELGISTQPIFTCFGSMEAVREAVYREAEQRYDEYEAQILKDPVPFLRFGALYIRFAKKEPELYRLLFLMQTVDGSNGAFEAMRHSQELVRPSLINTYHISEEDADRYFRDLWLVVHSLATLIVTGSCPYSDEDIGQIMTGFSISIFKAIKEIPGFTKGTFDRDTIFENMISQ